MGGDVSRPAQEWNVDSTAYETESYKLLKGVWSDGTKISVFGAKDGQDNMDSLSHSSKMLRTLRHPCIMKHIQSCKLNACLYLLTEDVVPLEILLAKQEISLVEVIAGLHDVLSALDFLHTKCGIQHNNVSTSSIFVAANGSWRLGGFEDAGKYDCKASNEPVHANDMFAYGELAVHLLNIPFADNTGDDGGVAVFLERVKEECLNADPSKRSTSTVLYADTLFRNDFVEIKSFLQNLILKPEEEKVEFFQSLNKRLSAFSTSTISSHVLPLVWSRLVFLEPSARKHFLPCLLRPKHGKSSTSSGLLPSDLYKTYVIPKLLKILHVHDHQIRILILDHFNYFAYLFSKAELHEIVLPEILLGVRDSSNDMVAASLRAVACLVNLLGANVVIGQNNQPIFTDNRPNKSQMMKEMQKQPRDISILQLNKVNSTSLSPLEPESHVAESVSASSILSPGVTTTTTTQELFQASRVLGISERSSPDGGESAEDEAWSDWEDETVTSHELSPPLLQRDEIATDNNDDNSGLENNVEGIKANLACTQLTTGLGEEFDIMALNIKAVKSEKTDVDFFSDMEPKLLTVHAQELLMDQKELLSECKKAQTLFSVLTNDAEQECNGWEDSELQVDW